MILSAQPLIYNRDYAISLLWHLTAPTILAKLMAIFLVLCAVIPGIVYSHQLLCNAHTVLDLYITQYHSFFFLTLLI